jgi:hypothetical protein
MNLRFPSVVWAYLALALFFSSANLFDWPYDGPSVPRISLKRNPDQTLAGLLPNGLKQINHASLKSSINRLSTVRIVREFGNSLRLFMGQRVKWIIWGRGVPLMLFGTIELPVARGVTPLAEQQLTQVVDIIAGYDGQLSAEGWRLVVMPVPIKLAIHREYVDWPILDSDLVSRRPITKDCLDEFYAFFQKRLAERMIPNVDLHTVYRKALGNDPNLLLYAPNDSHWSGGGITLAAHATADVIARVSPLKSREPIRPTFFKVKHVGDLAKAHDLWPGLTTWLRSAWEYEDLLLNGEEMIGYTHPINPVGLVAAVGTSYTGQYTWLSNQPVGFAWQLSLHLENVQVQNRPFAGLGSFYSFEQFWKRRNEIATDFDSKYGSGRTKIVVWEFPIRDVMVILGHSSMP